MARQPISIYDAVQRLAEEFRNNPEFAQSWRDNIATAFQDEFDRHVHLAGMITPTDMFTLSNYAANNFLSQFCHRNRKPLSQVPNFREEPEVEEARNVLKEELMTPEQLGEAIEIAKKLQNEEKSAKMSQTDTEPVKNPHPAGLFRTKDDIILDEFKVEEFTLED